MPTQRTKVHWAAVRITDEQAIIVYTLIKGSPVVISYDRPDAFRKAINDKALSVRKWAVSVPDEFCIKKTIEMPAHSLDEAAQMVEFELPSLVPIPVEDIIYGCATLKADENIYEISVYILRKDVLAKLLQPYRSIGIDPAKVLPDSIALYSGLTSTESEGTIVLFAEKAQSYLLTASQDAVRDCKCLKTVDSTQNLEHIASEIAQKEVELRTHSESNRILIAADHRDFTETLPTILNSMGVISKIMINPECSRLPDNIEFSFYDSMLAAGTFTAASDSRYEHLNLLPAEQLHLVQNKEKKRTIFVNAALGVLVLLLIWANFSISNWRIKRACQKVRSLIAPIEHIATDVDQKRVLVRAVQTQTSDRQKISDFFNELYKYSPESITISELRYHQKAGKRYISLKGQTDSLPKAFDYSEVMKKSVLLNQMQILNVQQIPTPSGSIVEFRAECLLKDV